MILFGYYLLKVTLCSGLLLGYYWLALRNKIFHQWNRFYLLACVGVAILVPFIKLPFLTPPEEEPLGMVRLLYVASDNDAFVAEVSGHAVYTFTTAQWLQLSYGFVSLLLVLLMLIAAFRIATIYHKYPAQKFNAIQFVNTKAKGTPFSFFNLIFWNQSIPFSSPYGQQIFNHELVHVREKHTLDKLFMLLVLIPFWINPFFWFIRKELHALHEFIADKKAVGGGDTEDLARMILNSIYPQQQFLFTSHFFQSTLKRRLHMFQQLKSTKMNYVSRILALPVLVFIFAAFTVKVNNNETPRIILDKKITVVIDAGHGGDDNGANSNGITEKELNLAIAQKIKAANNNTNINIVLTRTGDVLPNLEERVKLAGEEKAELYISVHVGATANANTKSGIEVVVPSQNNGYQKESEWLGSLLATQLNTVYPTKQQLVQKQVGIYVLNKNVCPAVLLELGYINNAKDLAFIRESKNQEAIAKQILAAIERFASQKEKTGFLQIEKEAATTKMEAKPLQSTKERGPFSNAFEQTAPDTVPAKKVIVKEIKKEKGIDKEKEKQKVVEKDNVEVNEIKKEKPQKKETIPVFTKVEVEPEFPGGVAGWRKFLQANINAETPVNNGAPAGQFTVMAQFIVDKEGNITDLRVLTNHGYGMEEEVKRLLSLSPKWIPAKQNGRTVMAYKKQPITFVISEEDTETEIKKKG